MNPVTLCTVEANKQSPWTRRTGGRAVNTAFVTDQPLWIVTSTEVVLLRSSFQFSEGKETNTHGWTSTPQSEGGRPSASSQLSQNQWGQTWNRTENEPVWISRSLSLTHVHPCTPHSSDCSSWEEQRLKVSEPRLLSALGRGGFPAEPPGPNIPNLVLFQRPPPPPWSECSWCHCQCPSAVISCFCAFRSGVAVLRIRSESQRRPLRTLPIYAIRVKGTNTSVSDSLSFLPLAVQQSEPWRLWSSCCWWSASVRLLVCRWVSLPSSLMNTLLQLSFSYIFWNQANEEVKETTGTRVLVFCQPTAALSDCKMIKYVMISL